jgi:hypothetical protein
MNKKFIILIVAIILIAAGGVSYFFISKQSQKQIVCTMEARICPDGSSVGRIGPNCEFATCPEIKANQNIIGYEFGELKLLSKNNNIYKFEGKVSIDGKFFKEKLNFEEKINDSEKEKTCIIINEDSYLKLPISSKVFNKYGDSTLSHMICFNETEKTNKLISIDDSGDGTFLIENYVIYYNIYGNILSSADLLEAQIKTINLDSNISTWEDYRNDKYGYSFKIIPSYFIYKKDNLKTLDSITITDRVGLQSSLCSCGAFGAAISIEVLENKEKFQLRDWIDNYLNDNNETIQGDIKEIKIDEKNGLMVEIGEMGGGTLIVVENNNLIYKIRGYFSSYPESKSYSSFISTFKFLK